MPQKNKSILIVNSDQSMRDYLCERLPFSGFKPVCSDSIRCALKKIAEFKVDAIICDETLKDGSGLDLIQRLRNCGQSVPVGLLISGAPDLTEISACAQGADLVFHKPFGLQDFVDGLHQLLKTNTTIPSVQTAWFSRDNNQNFPHRA